MEGSTKVAMANIIEEALDIAGEDRVDLVARPGILDIVNKRCACIRDRGALSTTKLIR